MKRVGYLYPKIYDIDNIRCALYNASKDKRRHKYVKTIMANEDYYVYQIHKMLKEKTFAPSEPTVKIIQDNSSGKVRTIHKPRFFPDQIIHWALMQQLQLVIMRGMYAYSCGSVPGRGSSYGQRMVRKWIDTDKKNTKYCLKMDVSKFYPSIDNEMLKRMFSRKVKDKDCLWLIDTIVDTNKGQPIGYYTSQWFANFFLEGLDHYIKANLGAKYYVRYVDDLVIFGSNKKKLHNMRKAVERYLNDIHLNMKSNWQVFSLDKRDVDFLGIRFFRHKTTLRRRNSLRIRRRIRKVEKKGFLNDKDASAILSYWGWIKRTDSYLYYHKYVKPCITLGMAKKVVSQNARARHRCELGIDRKKVYILKI